MKNNISTGSDGLTVDFYKFFWRDLKCYIASAKSSMFKKKGALFHNGFGLSLACLINLKYINVLDKEIPLLYIYFCYVR